MGVSKGTDIGQPCVGVIHVMRTVTANSKTRLKLKHISVDSLLAVFQILPPFLSTLFAKIHPYVESQD